MAHSTHILRPLHRLLQATLISLLPTLLAGCMADDPYSTSPTDLLSFSTDTVNLDTIISGKATNTYTFEVYNPSKRALRLSSVALEKGTASLFRVNVDGVFLEGGVATGLEIGAQDSLRVFLFVNAPATDSDEPVELSDNVVFTTEGGAVQRVALRAYSQDVVTISESVISRDTVLSARRPYVITDSLTVSEGCTLTLSPGVRLYFAPSASLIVRGTLKAEGTPDARIQMRGDRLGYMFSQQPYDRIPGQWGGVVLTKESTGNRLSWCDIHSGSFGIRVDSTGTDTEKLRLENSVVHNVSGDGLNVRCAKVFVGNCQITNAGGNCVTLLGGSAEFVQCTIANFYAFTGGRGCALSYANEDGTVRLPLEEATFRNCLITGYSTDEIFGTQSAANPDDAYNFLFENCLLNTSRVEDERIVRCLWDAKADTVEVWRETNFSPDFDLTTLTFSFQLSEKSQARDHADKSSANQYPLDLAGRSRMADGKPDIGCFEFEAKEESGGEQ